MQRYLRNIDWWLVGAVCALMTEAVNAEIFA